MPKSPFPAAGNGLPDERTVLLKRRDVEWIIARITRIQRIAGLVEERAALSEKPGDLSPGTMEVVRGCMDAIADYTCEAFAILESIYLEPKASDGVMS